MIVEEVSKLENHIVENNKSNNSINNNLNSNQKIEKTNKNSNCNKKKNPKEPSCYFKLISMQIKHSEEENNNYESLKNFEDEYEFLVETKVCIIGRSMSSYKNNGIRSKIENDIFYVKIGSSRFISRRHCKIYWFNGEWYIKNLSKVSIYVGNQKLNKSDSPIILKDVSPISSLAFRFYFVKALKA